jgi:hypothetical protein
MMRGKDSHEYEGGWLFPKQNKIAFYSGSLGHVSDQSGVANAINNHLGTYLRAV